MNIQTIISLIATIAYIPLFVILLSNRPWDRKRKFFFLFLIAAAFWSFSSFLHRSNFDIQNKELEIKIITCAVFWMIVQLHYLLLSFYKFERIKVPWAYLFLVAAIVLAALDYIPQAVVITNNGISVDYGPWILAIYLLFLLTVGIKDIYSLIHRYRLSSDPAERNQIVYLLAAIVILVVCLLSSFVPILDKHAVTHIGNFVITCVLTYAVVAHRLLDFRRVFSRVFINVISYSSAIGIVLLVYWLVRKFGSIEFDEFASLLITLAIGIPVIVFLGHKLVVLWQRKVE